MSTDRSPLEAEQAWRVEEITHEYSVQTTQKKPHACVSCGKECGCIFHEWEPRSEKRREIVGEDGKPVFTHGASLIADEAAMIVDAPVMFMEIQERASEERAAWWVVRYVVGGKRKNWNGTWDVRQNRWTSYAGGSCTVPLHCQVCGDPCGVHRVGGEERPKGCEDVVERSDWSVSDLRRCILQGISSGRQARMIAAAPVMARILGRKWQVSGEEVP